MDLSTWQWLVLAGITLVGAVAQTAIGFGFALITVPVFLLLLPLDAAIQLGMLLSLAITLLMIAITWRDIPWHIVRWILIGSVAGFPLGVALYHVASAPTIKIAVALSIMVAIGAAYWRTGQALAPGRGNGLACGLVSGAMVTSIAMAGPAIAVYASLGRFTKSATRATIFAVFLFSYPLAIGSQVVVYGLSPLAWQACLYMLPVIIGGCVVGQWLSGRISDTLFRNILSGVLVVVAVYLGCESLLKLL